MRTRIVRLGVALAIGGLVLAACGSEGGEDEAATTGSGEGGSLTMLHALTGDVDTAGLNAALDKFTEETGITVEDQGSSDFEQLVRSRVEGGNPPDIVLHPQPGLLEDFADQGLAKPLDSVDQQALLDATVTGSLSPVIFDDALYGVPVRVSLKSLVWYPIPEFEDAGYEIPASYEGLMDLTNQIREDGNTPWCIGIESSGATGWVMTDWIEDLMLRAQGGDVYDQWVNHEIPFDSPEVASTIEDYIDPIWFTDDNVVGGRPNILATSFGDSVLPMFNDPPGCYLHRQASFIQGFFPDGTEIGTDVGFFYLPPLEGEESPALIAGDYAAAYSDNPAIDEFMDYFATPESGEPWAAEGAWLSPFTDFDTSTYASDALKQQGEILADADFARFDASDLMPGAVGAGAFWTEMVSYVNDQQDLQTTLSNIDAAWPSS